MTFQELTDIEWQKMRETDPLNVDLRGVLVKMLDRVRQEEVNITEQEELLINERIEANAQYHQMVAEFVKLIYKTLADELGITENQARNIRGPGLGMELPPRTTRLALRLKSFPFEPEDQV
jgi:hypothetical protein